MGPDCSDPLSGLPGRSWVVEREEEIWGSVFTPRCSQLSGAAREEAVVFLAVRWRAAAFPGWSTALLQMCPCSHRANTINATSLRPLHHCLCSLSFPQVSSCYRTNCRRNIPLASLTPKLKHCSHGAGANVCRPTHEHTDSVFTQLFVLH